MCKTISEGGQRCAAHTRTAYEAAIYGTPEWDKAAAEFASTPKGRTELLLARQAAQDELDALSTGASQDEQVRAITRLAGLTAALERGETLREMNREAGTCIAEHVAAGERDAQFLACADGKGRVALTGFGVQVHEKDQWPIHYLHAVPSRTAKIAPDTPVHTTQHAVYADHVLEKGTGQDGEVTVAVLGVHDQDGQLIGQRIWVVDGHHTLIAARRHGLPVRAQIHSTRGTDPIDPPRLYRRAHTETASDATPHAVAAATEDPPWDAGAPATTVGEHWSVAEGGDRWHAGGCGAFAIAMTERWPHLKIAAEMYHDHGSESVAHAWAYDPATNTRFHIFGSEPWTPTEDPDYDPDSHRVLLDQSAADVRALFGGRNTSEDTVFDAMEVACEMFDPDYQPDPDAGDRRHLYFW